MRLEVCDFFFISLYPIVLSRWRFELIGDHTDIARAALNLLTPDVVARASKEITTGEHVQLDWSLDNVQFPGFGRKEFQQTVVDLAPLGFKAIDDEIYINTQSGSQWDSLKHVRATPVEKCNHHPLIARSVSCSILESQVLMHYTYQHLVVAHQKTGMYYNGLHHDDAVKTQTNGIHSRCMASSSIIDPNTNVWLDWCERGGIVGRGILVDWVRQAQ